MLVAARLWRTSGVVSSPGGSWSRVSVDVVLFTEVLEHLREGGGKVMPEIRRILKPDGVVILTTPFIYRLHEEPYDYGRFTTHYFTANASRWGFAVIDSRRSGNIVEVWATLWDDFWCLERARTPFSLPRRIWNTGMRVLGQGVASVMNASGLKLPAFYYLSTLCVLRKTG
jgi:SAM-dependent methyltransferase